MNDASGFFLVMVVDKEVVETLGHIFILNATTKSFTRRLTRYNQINSSSPLSLSKRLFVHPQIPFHMWQPSVRVATRSPQLPTPQLTRSDQLHAAFHRPTASSCFCFDHFAALHCSHDYAIDFVKLFFLRCCLLFMTADDADGQKHAYMYLGILVHKIIDQGYLQD